MDEKQELEWLEAQKIVVSVDLVAAAKQQLQFLAAVDKNRCLYEGPLLSKAIYRYKSCWLPLLAKHSESMVMEGPLVVPLDCEWIWHCHRLNPVQYKKDCEQFHGRILDNANVLSVVQGTSKERTAEIWNRLYPEEPYELNLSFPLFDDSAEKFSDAKDHIKYDLISAVKRQCSFFYQVSRPSMHDDRFLEGAMARYKGFLHLIKRNAERSMKRFCVPTYDIDLIWHSHQLNPESYCKDLVEAIGKVLEHDDTESDRSKGKKLDVGFSATTKQWEVTFGLRYCRAGAMYRGSAPSPVTISPWPANFASKNIIPCSEHEELQLTQTKVVEVRLEIAGVRNLPEGHRGTLFVSFSKSQPDLFFKSSRRLTILSESGEKRVTDFVAFECEPAGELLFILKSQIPSNLPLSRQAKTLGKTSISLQELLDPNSKLSVQKWFELVPNFGGTDSKPTYLHIAASSSVPVPSPHVLHMVRSRPLSVKTCFLPLPGKLQQHRGWTCVVNDAGKEIISIQMRNSKEAEAGNNQIAKREVVGVIGWSGEMRTLAAFVGTRWDFLDSNWSLHLDKKSTKGGHIFELRGNRLVKIFRGRKLEYEPRCCNDPRCCNKEKSECDFVTVVRFCEDHPYGKAVALLNLKSGIVKVNEGWFTLPGIVLAFILSDMLRKEGYSGFLNSGESVEVVADVDEEVNGFSAERKALNVVGSVMEVVVDDDTAVALEKDNGYGNTISSTTCAVSESEAGNAVKSRACGGGGGCGGSPKSSGCGSGCGGSCADDLSSVANSGNAPKSSGCGSGCGGGCGGGGCGGSCADDMSGAAKGCGDLSEYEAKSGVSITGTGGGLVTDCGDHGNDVKGAICASCMVGSGGCSSCGGGFGGRCGGGGCTGDFGGSLTNGNG